jgi:hypothetical protein
MGIIRDLGLRNPDGLLEPLRHTPVISHLAAHPI